MISILLFSTTILDIRARIASAGGLLPWKSWTYVHANLSQVRIVQSTETSTLLAIEATWWAVPVSSLVFAGMALVGLISCVQHDAYTGRSLGKWFRTTMLRRPEGDTFIQSSIDLSSHISMSSPTPPIPVHLKSGWDESFGAGRTAKIQCKRPALRCEIPTSPSTSTDTDGDSDASFKASTLNYLGSPTGQKASTLSSLPSLDSTLTLAPRSTPPVPALSSLNIPDGAIGASASSAHSILSSPWPEPPSTIPVTPTKSTSQTALSPRSPAHHPRSPSEVSLNTSLASSTVSTGPYLTDPDIFLHSVSTSPHRPPFQDGIPTSVPGIPSARRPKRMSSNEILSARALTSSVRRAAGKRREQNPAGEAVYMTVVHEIQAC
ncbi:hypothetical protein EIP86_006266 [Pleurotus ostreatoroseus]|nr:hypothetical protein EIP86_006266 [Pleurotus ostreatoroseus]